MQELELLPRGRQHHGHWRTIGSIRKVFVVGFLPGKGMQASVEDCRAQKRDCLFKYILSSWV